MIKQLNTMLHNDKHEDIFMVKQKVNEIILTVNNLENILNAILERAKRVNPEIAEVQPLTHFGFRPDTYCTCGDTKSTGLCPIHTQ